MVKYISQGLIFLFLVFTFSCRPEGQMKNVTRSIASFIDANTTVSVKKLEESEISNVVNLCFFMKSRNSYLASEVDGSSYIFKLKTVDEQGVENQKEVSLHFLWDDLSGSYYEDKKIKAFSEYPWRDSFLELYCSNVIKEQYKMNNLAVKGIN